MTIFRPNSAFRTVATGGSQAHAGRGRPVKALIVYNSNPAAVAPDQSAVQVQVARREALFTVVLKHFQTDTANYASFLLPATTQVEHWALQQMCGPSFRGAHPARGGGASQQRHLLYETVTWEALLN